MSNVWHQLGTIMSTQLILLTIAGILVVVLLLSLCYCNCCCVTKLLDLTVNGPRSIK